MNAPSATARGYDRSLWNVILIACIVVSTSQAQEAGRPDNLEVFAEKISWQQRQEPTDFSKFRRDILEAFSDEGPASIRNIISSELENRERTAEFLSFLKRDHGAIRVLQFKYFDTRKQRRNPTKLAVYHCIFADDSWWEMRVGLDESGRVNRFIITDPNFNEAIPGLQSKSALEFPFAAGEEWFVLWGGKTEELNYHVSSRAQRNALDLLIRHPFSQQSYQGTGAENSDYYAYGRAVLAPVQGVVVQVADGVADNVPGKMSPGELTGNTIVIRVAENEYLLLAHLKKSSISVEVGDTVSVGQPVARVGNSGNSSEPHLHIQMMSSQSMKDAIGIEMRFRRLAVNGTAIATNYSPVRADVISRVEASQGTRK